MSIWKRKHVFVDKKVQSALLWRCFIHWATCVAVVATIAVAFVIVSTSTPITFGKIWFQFRPALLGALLLLPILLADVVFLSNKFVGPLWRLRKGMQQLAAGERVAPLKFRKRDFWTEVADEFNAVVARLERESNRPRADAPPPEEVELTV